VRLGEISDYSILRNEKRGWILGAEGLKAGVKAASIAAVVSAIPTVSLFGACPLCLSGCLSGCSLYLSETQP
jgi:hypothetical protein